MDDGCGCVGMSRRLGSPVGNDLRGFSGEDRCLDRGRLVFGGN